MPDPLKPFEDAIDIEDAPNDDREPIVFTSREVHELVDEHKGLRDTIDNLRREDSRKDNLIDYLRNYVKLVDHNEGVNVMTEEELKEAAERCSLKFGAVRKFFSDEKLALEVS